jgi:glycolate oxidase iron-sulfur subunit
LFFAATRLFRNSGLPRLLLKTRLARLISPRAEFALALLESSRPIFESTNSKKSTRRAQTGEHPRSVLLFAGCVGEGLFARVNRATERVLTANGLAVTTPPAQVCCGALHAHAGDLEGARELARRNIAAFDSDAPVVTNAGGCGAMLETYGHLLAHDSQFAEAAASFSARVRDVSEQLQSGNPSNPCPSALQDACASISGKVTYDTSCHLLYGQHAGEASQQMLHSAVGPSFVPLPGTERCCGAAGIYNLLQPELSRRVLEEKLAHVQETNAEILATGNPGCQMQIGAGARLAGMKLQVCHPIELVDEAYARAGVYADGE